MMSLPGGVYAGRSGARGSAGGRVRRRRSGWAAGLLIRSLGLSLGLWLAACQPPRRSLTPVESRPEQAERASRLRADLTRLAQSVLGMQAEVLAHGPLAGNGMEQVLVINRFRKSAGNGGDAAGIYITRAAVLQKDGARWTEALRCDGQLKNPQGFLGGSSSVPVTGWRLEVHSDAKQGLELLFTPVDFPSDAPDAAARANRTILVRWNRAARRFQAVDQSQGGFLAERPTLETPQSILR